jgi:hypothetical protein
VSRPLSRGRGALLEQIINHGLEAGLAQRHTARSVRELIEDGLIELVKTPIEGSNCWDHVFRATPAGVQASAEHQAERAVRKESK